MGFAPGPFPRPHFAAVGVGLNERERERVPKPWHWQRLGAGRHPENGERIEGPGRRSPGTPPLLRGGPGFAWGLALCLSRTVAEAAGGERKKGREEPSPETQKGLREKTKEQGGIGYPRTVGPVFRRWPSIRAPALSLLEVPWTGPRGPDPHLEVVTAVTEEARFPGGVREAWGCRSRGLDPWPLVGLLCRQRLARVAEADPFAEEEFAATRWSCSTLQRPIPELEELGE